MAIYILLFVLFLYSVVQWKREVGLVLWCAVILGMGMWGAGR